MSQCASTGLLKGSTNVTPISMNNENEHHALASWLAAVATKRDKQAFTELFKYFSPKILRIASRKYGNESLATEILQETMTNVWRKAHLFNMDKGAPTTWVYTVMRNVSFDLLRKIKTKKEDNLSDDFWPLFDAEDEDIDHFSDHLASQQMLSCIETLPENQKSVIRGYYFMEMSQEQLAQHLDIPLGTVKSRLRLALAKLKEQIGEDHD